MAKSNSNKKRKDWREVFNSNAGVFVVVLTIFGFGFGTGQLVADIFHKIEMNESNKNHNDKLYEKVKEFDDLILELKTENQLLKVENEKLKK
ncbi:hypothetical protein [Algoriphagus sp.]|uniref:hypothetical protein n=1 Tax=Algoriphagus sp. TaxID=1872435 RepID=UPI0027268D58|nr:hypothetical protein [Algoriphagus sp.]MDO8968630.1 hypothetical protein [Algoriphagus sp.]MDP3201367.1 hypothetical protein [Algoriphagus sp.]